MLFESEVAIAKGIETDVRHRTVACVADEFPDQPRLTDDIALVVSELVANATRVARDRIVVRVVAGSDAVTVSVIDDGPGTPHVRHTQPDDPTGRGLLLIEGISESWGTERVGPQGKVVWARCTCE